MTDWRRTTTAELLQQGVIEIGDGYRAKNSEFVDRGGLPFVRVGDVGTTLRLDGLDELPRERAGRYGPKVSLAGDSLITMKGTVGRVAYVSADHRTFVYSPQVSYWRSHDTEQVHPRWLSYWLESPEFLGQALAAKGATDMADYINLRDQRRMRITLPPSPAQSRIAAVLASLDDLIQNNRRRIELLEQMAQAIYREWFVHFGYPGHEDVPLVDSPLGPIPEGWEVARLDEVGTVVRGRSYRKADLVEMGGLPFVNLKCMLRGGGFRKDGLKRYNGYHTSAQRVSAGDIVLAVTDLTQQREILARATLVPELGESRGVISLDVVRVVARSSSDRLPLFSVLRWSDFSERVKEFANGSTVLHLSPTHLERCRLLWPTAELRQGFAGIIGPAIGQANVLRQAGEHLETIRDLLLPKLITGQIEVSELDLDQLVESVA